jgi:hypothetical protein
MQSLRCSADKRHSSRARESHDALPARLNDQRATRNAASPLFKLMLDGPYKRRPRSPREWLRRVGLRGWLWIAAAIIAAIVVVLEFV